MRKETFVGFGSVALAFLASQHHTLHMLAIAAGVGGAGAGLMDGFPVLRRSMLLMSVIMAGFMLLRLRKPGIPRHMQVLNGASAALTAALVGWSVYSFGL